MNLSSKRVYPTGPDGADILVVGEAPGQDEDEQGIPYVGRAGKLLWDTFSRYAVSREQCKVTNILQYRPNNNVFELALNTSQLAEGLQWLDNYVNTHPPKVIAATGAIPLEYLTDRKGILAHRSSILPCKFNPNVKVIPTIHPAHIYRTPESYLFFDFDIHRVVEDSKFREFNYTQREYYLVDGPLTPFHLDIILSTGEIAVDIESTKDKDTGFITPITISFSPDKHRSVACVWNTHNYNIFKRFLESSEITKYFHYGWCFDIELLYLYGINVQGIQHDTYIMASILDPGLPKSLGFLSTTYTREPYYKKSGRDSLPDDTKVWGIKTKREDVLVYNSKDTAVTSEIAHVLIPLLKKEGKWEKYMFKLRCAEAAQEISRNGMLCDNERRKLFEKATVYKWTRLQQVLNMMAGREVNVNSNMGKRSVKHLLYDELGLPPRRNRKGELQANEKSLLSLVAYCQGEVDDKKTDVSKAQWMIKREIVKTIIDIRQLRKMISSYISIDVSIDNRIRSTYNVAGPETGRWSANKYVDDTGLNGMTLPRGDILIPDDMPLEYDPQDESHHNSIVAKLREEMANVEEDDEEIAA